MDSCNDMVFTFPGRSRVYGYTGPYEIRTDQPPDASAPGPFTLFLASIGACAGVYVQAFCRKRNIPTENIRIVQHNRVSQAGMVEGVELEVQLPDDFPDQYREAALRSAERCTVKQHLEHPPKITVEAVTRSVAASVA